MGDQLAQTSTPRPMCMKCLKAEVSCLCGQMRPFWTQHRFAILMHSKEHRDRRGTGTGRITSLCLQNSFLEVGHRFSAGARIRQEIRQHPRTYLLYPGTNSLDLSSSTEREIFHFTEKGPPALFVALDASWSCAGKMLRDNPFLRELPKVSFSQIPLSRFAFRKQPHPTCLSTLEAIYEVIQAVEPDPRVKADSKNLKEVFEALVHWQLSCNS
jgi:DTW domain-containing protein YfiP